MYYLVSSFLALVPMIPSTEVGPPLTFRENTKLDPRLDPNLVFYYLTPETIKKLVKIDNKYQKFGFKLDLSLLKFYLWTPGLKHLLWLYIEDVL